MMREEPASPSPRAEESSTANSTVSSTNDLTGSEFEALARADAEDGRKLKWSLGVAALFHGIVLLITFPQVYPDSQPPPERPAVFVMQPVKYKPPPPDPTPPIPEQRSRRVPWPDPEPEGPEPMLTDEPDIYLDLPPLDSTFLTIPDAPPSIDPVGPIIVTSEVTPPVKVYSPSPAYTEAARKTRTEGLMILQSIIDIDGNVTGLRVLKTLPMGLEQETIKTLKTWKFKPATLRGKPVSVYFNLTVNFKLQ